MLAAAGASIMGAVLLAWHDVFGLSAIVSAWLLLALIAVGLTLLVLGIYAIATAGAEEAGRAPSGEASEGDLADVERNRQVIASYHALAHDQAASAFRDSRIAMAVGFALLVTGGGYAIVGSQSTQAQVIVAALAALGSAFSAYLGATFIKVHNRALGQVYFFFGQPLVEGYLLRAEQLATRLTGGADNPLLARVVDAHLSQAAMAASVLGPRAEFSRPYWRDRRKESPDVDKNGRSQASEISEMPEQ
jgi:hypothetical protein